MKWKVYWEIGGERMGVLFADAVGLLHYRTEAEAKAAYRNVVRGLEEQGFAQTGQVNLAGDDVAHLVEYTGLARGDEVAVVTLLHEEEA